MSYSAFESKDTGVFKTPKNIKIENVTAKLQPLQVRSFPEAAPKHDCGPGRANRNWSLIWWSVYLLFNSLRFKLLDF